MGIHLMRVAQDKRDNQSVLREQEIASELGFSRQAVKDLRQIFNLCDDDGSRSCDTAELIKMLSSLHPKVDKKQLELVIAEVDEEGNDELEFPAFLKVMRRIQDQRI